MKQSDLHWLAGLLEGEGSFMKPSPSCPNMPHISLNMTDEDVVARAAALLGVPYHRYDRHPERGWKPTFVTHLRGRRAAALMRELYPLMGVRRKQQISNALDGYFPVRKILTDDVRRQIFEEYKSGKVTVAAVARKYSVSREHVHKIARHFMVA